MFFNDIIGSKKVIQNLINGVSTDHIPHAQIFLGPQGSNKLALALAYAQYILCEDRQADDSCGQCRSCLKAKQLMHPDLHISFPVVKKDSKKREETVSQDFMDTWRSTVIANPYISISQWAAAMGNENAQPNINTKECNDMIKQLGMRAFESQYKIQMVWLPEYLGKEGNRLLKLIEEPTDNTVIILVAEDQDRILGTVLSRCQVVQVGPLQMEEVRTYLNDKYSHKDETAIEQAVQMSDGNLLVAQQMLEGTVLDFADMLLQWMRLSYKLDFAALQEWSNALHSSGKDNIRMFLDYTLSYMREYSFFLQTNDTSRLSQSQKNTVANMAKIMTMDKVEALVLLIEQVKYDLVRNVNPRISLTAASIKLSRILRGTEAEMLYS